MLCSARYSNLAADIWQDTYCAIISNSQGHVATSNTVNTNVQWFALGKAQLQWGDGNQTATFPISFTSIPRVIPTVQSWGNDGAWSSDWWAKSITTTGMTFDGTTYKTYVALGKQ